jgi:hypothetical protein
VDEDGRARCGSGSRLWSAAKCAAHRVGWLAGDALMYVYALDFRRVNMAAESTSMGCLSGTGAYVQSHKAPQALPGHSSMRGERVWSASTACRHRHTLPPRMTLGRSHS